MSSGRKEAPVAAPARFLPSVTDDLAKTDHLAAYREKGGSTKAMGRDVDAQPGACLQRR